jgi:hypothetical protein
VVGIGVEVSSATTTDCGADVSSVAVVTVATVARATSRAAARLVRVVETVIRSSKAIVGEQFLLHQVRRRQGST